MEEENCSRQSEAQFSLEEGQAKQILLRSLLEEGFQKGEDIWNLLEKYGIDCARWESWLRDRQFTEQLVTLSKAMSGTYAPKVWNALLSMVENGSIPAMKLYFELWKQERPSCLGNAKGDAVLENLRTEIFRHMPAPPAIGDGTNYGEDADERTPLDH